MQYKKCTVCGNEKTLDQFSPNRLGRHGKNSQCRECKRIYQAAYNKSPAGRATETRRLKKATWKTLPPQELRARNLRNKYGITQGEFQGMLEAQGGRCAICETSAPGGRHNVFHIDHCHATGIVRGLLCNNCNTVLGRMGDNLSGVMKVVRYLNSVLPKVPDDQNPEPCS